MCKIHDARNVLEKDCDAILYSSALRRLRGVTQVMPVVGDVVRVHDRMMHSFKVAQVGKRLAENLLARAHGQGNCDWFGSKRADEVIFPSAVYAAGLAHDLGHPPFGHVAEAELQKAVGGSSSTNPYYLPDGFEGNAQTFRVVTRLSCRKDLDKGDGLRLSPITLVALSKYPWSRGRAAEVITDWERSPTKMKAYYNRKWGHYDSEGPLWNRCRAEAVSEAGKAVGINAQIMDLADDITYAVHDIQDYFRAGLIPLHFFLDQKVEEMLTNGALAKIADAVQKKGQYRVVKEDYDGAIAWIKDLRLPAGEYDSSTLARSDLHAFECSAIDKVMEAIDVRDAKLDVSLEARLGLEMLKQMTWYYVIDDRRLAASQKGQRRIVSELFKWLCEWVEEDYNDVESSVLRRFPRRLTDCLEVAISCKDEARYSYSDHQCYARAVIDYMVSLTDAEAVALHRSLGGISSVEPIAWL